jgi:hypothetical protein
MWNYPKESDLSDIKTVEPSAERLLVMEVLEKKEKTDDNTDLEAVAKKKSVVESTVKRRILLTG